MKTYFCPRCGKRFQGRLDRCPRCAQLIVYEVKGKYFNALGDELTIDKEGHPHLLTPNPKAPK